MSEETPTEEQRPLGVYTRPKGGNGWRDWVTTVDHKKIGILYGAAALFFFIIGGIEALLIRLHLATPNGTVLGAEMYTLEQAIEPGLIDEVVKPEDLMKAAKEKAKDLQTMGHPSYSITKELFIAEPMSKINDAMKELTSSGK